MDAGALLGIVAVGAPLIALVVYGIGRLIGKIQKPEGLPPGRRGGMGRIGVGGVPLSDALYEDARTKTEEAETDN